MGCRTYFTKIKRIIAFRLVTFMVIGLLFPAIAIADNSIGYNADDSWNINIINEQFEDPDIIVKQISDNSLIVVKDQIDQENKANIETKTSSSRKVLLTAYNSEVGQCDDSPCITANGFNVCEHGIEDTIAANFLKFGTKVKIPELFGDRVFIVRDRMNQRYSNRIDIWMKDKSDAKQFGVKLAMVEVLN